MGARTAPKMTEYLSIEDIRNRASELMPNRSKAQIQELRSAIKRFADAVRRPAASIPADPEVLRALIAKASPQLAGISNRRWANIRSLIDGALAEIDVLTIRARQRCALSAAWQGEMDLAKKLKTVALLSRFARWCSREGIEPHDVGDSTFNEFEAELSEFSLARDPATNAAEARRAWNAAVAEIPDWVGKAVPTRCRRRTISPAWGDLPSSFVADVDDYAARRVKPSRFDEFEQRPLRSVTVKGHVSNLRRFAGYLIQDGVSAGEFVSIRALLAPANVKRGLELIWGEDETASHNACQSAHDFVSIARFLGFEDDHLEALIRMARRCRRPQFGLTLKNNERLSIFDDPDALEAMYLLPARIAERLHGINDITFEDAVDMRLAACIEILLVAPIRRLNLAQLDLTRHFVWPTGKDGEARITVPSPEVKNRTELHHFLPPDSTALVRMFIDRFRPLMAQGPSTALFPGGNDGFMDPGSLGRIVRQGLHRHLGIQFNAHLFRHFACMNHLRENPGDYETLRRVCGHKRLETLVAFYAGTETEAAVRRFHEKTVLRIRHRAEEDVSMDMV